MAKKEKVEETTETKEPTTAELELESAKEIVEPLARADKSEDEMIVTLIQEGGFGFKKAARMLNLALEALELRMSAKDRYAKVSELLLDQDFAPTEWSEVVAVASYLSEEIDATDEKQAMKAVRRFAKDRDIELPKRPAGGGGGGQKTGFRTICLEWMVENATSTDEEFKAWLVAGDRPKGDYLFYGRIFSAARKMAEKIAA